MNIPNFIERYLCILGFCVIYITVATSCTKDDNTSNNTFKDLDGNIYHTVTIGTQIWMVENLKTTKFSNGDPIPYISDEAEWEVLETPAYCDYLNFSDYANTYGHLYNGYTVMDSRKIAPAGWHVPTEEELNILIEYLGGIEVAGGKMKSTGHLADASGLWQVPNEGAINSSGFNGLPGGYRNDNGGWYANINEEGNYWTSTNYGDGEYLLGFDLEYDNTAVDFGQGDPQWGYSVRCIKD